MEQLTKTWFDRWENGDFYNLPISENFKHTSPYGTINGKKEYLELVEANTDKFLGHRFEIQDTMFDKRKACIRYTAVQGDFRLDVTEWHFVKDGLIDEIIAYYNIAEERIKID